MDILQGGVGAAMAGEERNLMNIPSTGGEIREPKVTEGMRGKLLDA